MHPYSNHSEILNQVLCLSPAEEQNPIKVFDNLFSDYGLPAVRKHLWEMLVACLSSENPEYNSPTQRLDQITLWHDLEKFVEAAFILWTASHAAGFRAASPSLIS
jgi:hypothetical protein